MQVSLFKRGPVWWVQWRKDGERSRRSLGTGNKKVAEELRRDLEYELLRADREPSTLVAKATRVRIGKLLDEYEEYSRATKRPKTVLNDQARIRNYLEHAKPKWVGDVTTGNVTSYLSHRALVDSLQPATILREREILHALMNFAVGHEYLVKNPVSAVPRPRLPQREPRFLSLDQIDELLQAVRGDEIECLVAVAVFAGLRREELCWLTWDDLERVGDRHLLRVRQKVIDGDEWMPKTKKHRAIPVSARLAEALDSHERRGDCPWLFPSPQDCRWNPDNLGRRFRSLMKKAGLRWNFLDLRHTFGSQLARKGASDLKIAKLMGNSPEIARRHYINLVPEAMMEDVNF